jgi:hypothetical protein
VRFTEQDVDQARAAGVLIEFERGRPIIVDRPLYRELVKGAIKRTHAELEAKVTAAARRIGASGVRFVIRDMRTNATKTRKDGTRGRLRYDYADHRDPQAAIARLWKVIDAAKTADAATSPRRCASASSSRQSRLSASDELSDLDAF